MSPSIIRYAPNREFPSYTYVPGQWPHPIRDPMGHSHNQHVAVTREELDDGERCEAYRFGIDLFNAAYYWESHEQWEACWLALDRTGDSADFLKGLIKLAAAGVKAREGQSQGVQRHAKRAAEIFESLAEVSPAILGCQLQPLVHFARQIEQSAAERLHYSAARVQPVWNFRIELVRRQS